MAKPATVASSDTFATWRDRTNTIIGQYCEVVESASSNPPDNSSAYEDGTLWIRQDTDTAWVLVHTAASSAVWTQLGATPGALKDDGTVPLQANWDAGAYTITALRFISDQTTGTAPFTVASTTTVSNLSAEFLDGATKDNLNVIQWTVDTTDGNTVLSNGIARIVSGITATRTRTLNSTFTPGTTRESIIFNGDDSSNVSVDPNGTDNLIVNGTTLGNGVAYTLRPGEGIVCIPHVANTTWNCFTFGKPALNSISPDMLNDFAAYTLLFRNAGTAGAASNAKISTLTEEATPAAGDWLLGEASTGELRKFDVGNIAPGNDSVSNTQLANMAAYTIKLRNAGTTGDPGDVKISALTTEAAPTAGDYLLMEESGGALRKVDFGYWGSISTKDYWSGTQASYDGLGTWDANTIYFITN